ncbi:tRNA uridine-5-carboxymethylaminomethyl(34) synthesis GTPase MnmE [Nitrosospira sp. Is2]|uniref:tRNA uridine-5-carboxymethylaminomethyl(34) synthesis GTPase MnmE n=1 Tax=Nitrosospira sp. Is2 TaxID=3080532 RepID=UPI002955B409|nr:tRNA uridine-5-carboxymethylaminomethyl(34) synthesis GTPase MnmE [Nitrosospira sp. Is2]WON75282.1 tRNA uridine-5-carboxymethylaminomethyl(34) synthesis GTPase MnmE [Nitrosospira sp. Is2]
MVNSDIIAAIATPPGRGGIGVVRVSGGSLGSLALKITGSLPPPRQATLSKFLDEAGLVIDQGIVLYFPAPYSYTGEDVLELQGHGGPAVMNLLLSSCLSAGARLAQPGEFTLRAFLNNKLDLAQAESVADIIDASTSEAARCAMRSLQGDFSNAVRNLVEALTTLRMLVEASLDFPEEEIESAGQGDLQGRLEEIRAQVEHVLTSAMQGSLLREGVRVVLVGQPNVGKSSLLNRLTREETAIVTEIPGTTRDAIRETIEIEGVPVHVVDTAGLRDTQDAVEKIGMARTREAISKANLILLIMDSRRGITAEDRGILGELPSNLPIICVYNKIDLEPAPPHTEVPEVGSAVYVSAKTGLGVEELRKKLLGTAGWQPHASGEGIFMARQRHLYALTDAGAYLKNAASLAGQEVQLDLLAEELRLAQKSLSSITGEFSADDLLGEIFSRFCIGK